ncbi:dirigent protein 22-like [Salvia miltiorrhiza]|uniref:dirigent protein 22-like n=1 Tax=Salvia miltiorrhiza TaxID=226208 RepID=UPI0025AB72AB|nr:dirigent protein 22-like [Salvia miltiorrhiza]
MKNPTIVLLLIICGMLFSSAAAGPTGTWSNTVRRGRKQTTTLHFYVHDVRGGPNATLFAVASAPITANSPTRFGQINVFDDLATAQPDINSPEVARVQGTTTSADLRVRAIAMNVNFFITAGEFNGSAVSVIGRNAVTEDERELSVAGGTKAFRNARGYAITKSYSNDPATNYSVIEYTIYVTTRV